MNWILKLKSITQVVKWIQKPWHSLYYKQYKGDYFSAFTTREVPFCEDHIPTHTDTYPSQQIFDRSLRHTDTQAFCSSSKYKYYCKTVSNYIFAESEVHMTAFHVSLVKVGCGIHIHLKGHAVFISRGSSQLIHTAPAVTLLPKGWEDQAANLPQSILLL